MICNSCKREHPSTVRCEVARRISEWTKANGETPLDQPVVPVVSETKDTGVDSRERPACPVCAERMRKQRERMKKWRKARAAK